MKKIVLATLTACLLFCLSPQLMAKVWVIEINVLEEPAGNFYIDMGEKYAYAVPPEATIKWTCDFPFEVQFIQNALFETKSISSRAIEKKIKPEAKLLEIYKYTVTITKDGKTLTLDPVIIVKPPRT